MAKKKKSKYVEQRVVGKPCQGPDYKWHNTRCDDHCTKCGEDLGVHNLEELFAGVRYDADKMRTARHPCPHCGSIQLVELNFSFTIRYTGMRKKRKD